MVEPIRRKKSSAPKVISAVLFVFVLLAGAFVGVRQLAKHDLLPDLSRILPYGIREKSDSVSLPGYTVLNLQADTVSQNLVLENPAKNDYWLVISLRLSDGTVLWKSRPVAPGKHTEAITLTKPLSVGTYEDASLCYTCYADGAARQALNSANTSIKLLVN